MTDTTERIIYNRSGGQSAYTLRRAAPAPGFEDVYTVTGAPRGKAHTWYVHGHNGMVIHTADTTTLPAYVSEAVEQEYARDRLRALLPPGTTVYTILHHVGRSGMSRRVGVRAIVDDNPMYLDGLVHAAEPSFFPLGDREGIVMGGCGMDMGFHLVYSLSRMLYPEGHPCLGEKSCPSNDHSNDYNGFSRAYDEEHADGAPWWLTGDYELSEEDHELRQAYREAKRAAWEAGEAARYSPKRIHSDGGYALSQRWM